MSMTVARITAYNRHEDIVYDEFVLHNEVHDLTSISLDPFAQPVLFIEIDEEVLFPHS